MGSLGCDAHGVLNDAEFSKPMPSIGLYVASASLLCSLAMAADLLRGFRHRKFWFPCKYFSLNATSLTFIAVGIKLSVDLNTSMPSRHDQLSKLSSSVFVCTVMGNSMPSLGIMEDRDLLTNLVALAILVVTDVVNICIQLGTGAIYVFKEEHFVVVLLMLLMLMIMSFSATTVPTTKRILETKYKKKYEVALKCPLATERITVAKKIQGDLSKFWMMAHTSSPQFVMARSVTCTASGFFCLLSAVTLGEAVARSYLLSQRSSSLRFCDGDSDYKWSTSLVLVCQASAVAVGTVAPAIRWFTAVKFRCPIRGNRSYRDEFRVESYWTQWFSEKKQRPLSSLWILKDRSCRKTAHDAKRWLLDVCIGVQYVIVFASKIIRYISVYCVSRILLCFHLAFRATGRSTVSHVDSEMSGGSRQELGSYVLHLEGEDELVDLMVRSNREATEHWVKKGRKNQPVNLIELLEATTEISKGFEGIREFDSNEVASLAPSGEQPPNCWALPLVTMTTIALALPDVKPCSVQKLLNAVNEALDSVNKFECVLDTGGQLGNLRNAAEVVWLGVDLYHKWFDVDLRKLSKQQRSPEETIRELAEAAKKEFSESWQMNLMVCMKHRPSHWPIKTLAANSMYRICQTILLNYETRDYGTGEALLRKLETTISDIVSGCFCNVVQVVSVKCLVTAVEVREESVRGAALHLGRTEKILEIVERRRLPELRCDQMKNIDEWRAFYKMNSSDCNSSKTVCSDSNEVCITVD
ncbi:Uncharacterized protein Rs2_32406 [Raphanus sativus]|uniref:Uncharacterized protein LOC108818488 n=1 Tax=Raphanus sativus TaxID=3726 RepID=A0A6J0KHH9_RAPSA|nr:uncharacterized protein LOC108818488 [Raphanus sativus]KAJ4882313.1 Uncharacterized protein Rs2_32406 [Raphanus sativus]